MMKTEILLMHIVDDDGETVLAKIECFDESSASVEINSVFTLAEWRELAAAIDNGMVCAEVGRRWKLTPSQTPSPSG